MTKPGPRAGGPTARKSFSSAQKLEHIAAYEAAMTKGDGGSYLRANGLYSSLMCEWRRQRDAGVLAGKKPGEKIGRLTAGPRPSSDDFSSGWRRASLWLDALA